VINNRKYSILIQMIADKKMLGKEVDLRNQIATTVITLNDKNIFHYNLIAFGRNIIFLQQDLCSSWPT